MKLTETVRDTAGKIRLYGKTPPPGRYMNYREILSYSVGGIGVYFIFTVVTTLMVSTTNSILASGIGIDYNELYTIWLLSTIIGIPLTMLRARMVDNSLNKKGKYRPFLISMGIPTVLLSVGYVWMPYERWIRLGATADEPHGWGYMLCCVIILLFNIGFQFYYNFYYDAYNCLIYVMSPNTQERTDAVAFKSVVYSLAPSIVNAAMPFLAQAISGGSMVDIKLYRYVYPPIATGGFLISLIVYANVREKIVQARTHLVSIRLWDAFKTVAKNKYFWIISLAGWLGFLEGAYGQIFLWLYEYGHACSAAEYAIIQTVYGNASLWGMIAAPFAIKKFGKKKVIVATNLFNILFILLMLPNVSSIYWVLFCLYMNALVGSFTHILDPSVQADIRDYQHYISGERIDGMFATVGIIGTFITMITGKVLPMIYEKMGLSAAAHPELGQAYMTVLDIDKGYTGTLFGGGPLLYEVLKVLIIASAIGAVFNVVPYFFYDLSEQKHRGMVKVLKIRALFEDYGNGVLSDRDKVDAIDLINTAKAHSTLQPQAVSKALIRQAKRSGDTPKLQQAKKDYAAAVERNEWIADAPLVLQEISKFETSSVMKQQLRLAQTVYARGFAGLGTYDESALSNARSMPKTTDDERKLRAFALRQAKELRAGAKLVEKYYPAGIEEFDVGIFDRLFRQIDETDAAIRLLYREREDAKRAKDMTLAAALRQKLEALRGEKKRLERQVKDTTKEYSRYNTAAKPYLDSRKLLLQQENYSRFEEIAADYDAAKERAALEQQRLQREQEEREKEEKEFARRLTEEREKKKKNRK